MEFLGYLLLATSIVLVTIIALSWIANSVIKKTLK